MNGSSFGLTRMGLGTSFGLNTPGRGAGVDVLGKIRWNRGLYPLSVYKDGSGWHSNFDRNNYVPDSRFVTTYYVDFGKANDSANGLSFANAKKSISAAVTLGNATGQPFKIRVETDNGTYVRANGLTNSNTVFPTQDCAIVAAHSGVEITDDSKRATVGMHDALTWPGTPDATYTNCYLATRSNVARVFDIATINSYGDYTELTSVADAATCDTTPGSWAQVGSSLYVNRTDAAAVTNTNTRAYLIAGSAISLTAAHGFSGKFAYLRGVNIEGGNNGVMEVTSLVGSVVVAESCSFKYGGAAAYVYDNVPILDCQGLFAFKNCLFASSWKDGLNLHYTPWGTVRQTFCFTENCSSHDHGRGTSTSNQGITGHENVVGVDVNGNWTYGRGGTVRWINDSRLGAFGSASRFDLLDSTGDPPILWHTVNTAEFYLTDCIGEGANAGDYALDAFTGTTIHIRNFTATNAPNRNGHVVNF